MYGSDKVLGRYARRLSATWSAYEVRQIPKNAAKAHKVEVGESGRRQLGFSVVAGAPCAKVRVPK